MDKLRHLGRWSGLMFAAGLAVVVRWHDEIGDFVGSHRDVAFFVVLAPLLAIPARFIALGAAYLFELLLVGWSRSSLKMLWEPAASVRLDILSIVIMLLLPHRRLGYFLSFGILYATDAYLARDVHLSLTRFMSVWELQVICFIVFQSFLQYWMHRLEHSIPALWALHKFHHSADRMSILTSARQTQLNQGVEASIVLLPMGLLTSPTAPLPPADSPAFIGAVIIFAYQTFILMNGYLVHSNLRTSYGWIGRWLLVSPRMHRLHHATTPLYHDRNFSFDLVIWDRLFGTYATCDTSLDAASIPIGLDDNPFNSQVTARGVLRDYFLTTYLLFWRELTRGLGAWWPSRGPTPAPSQDR